MSEHFKKALFDLENTDWAASFDDAAQCILDEYVLSAPNMGRRNFEPFCKAFSQYAVNNPQADFHYIQLALSRRSQENHVVEQELFDEVRQQLVQGDTKGLILLLEHIKTNCPTFKQLNTNFSNKFRNFIAEQIRHYYFTDKQLAVLNQTLTSEVDNSSLQDIFENASKEISAIREQNNKRDIDSLNRWAYTFKSNDLLKKLSFRSTYINLAYELLVRKREIKNISPEVYYQKHRLTIQKKIKELTGTVDTKGKTICRKYALNKVYKQIATSDSFKFDSLSFALQKCENKTFYEDCKVILKALEGGKKYREVQSPQKPFIYYEH